MNLGAILLFWWVFDIWGDAAQALGCIVGFSLPQQDCRDSEQHRNAKEK